MKLSLLIDKYVIGPSFKVIIQFFQFFFVCIDKLTGKEISVIIDEEELQEYRNDITLSVENVPDEFKKLLPLATKWGVGDDAIRGDITDSATESDKQELIVALTGKLGSIDRWIDSYPEGSMTEEAAAFMYMGEAIDEMELEIAYDE